MKKVVFLSYVPLTLRIVDNFFLNSFKKKNIEIEYWDLSEIWGHQKIYTEDFCNTVKIFKISSYKDFWFSMTRRDHEKKIFISLISPDFKTSLFYCLLKISRVKTAYFFRAALPPLVIKKSLTGIGSNFARLFRGAIFRILNSVFKFWNFDVNFVAGKSSFTSGKEVVCINSIDYDFAIKAGQESPLSSKPYCVFLDDGLVCHSDYEMLGFKRVPKEQYLSELNSFFSQVEKTLKLEVIIAVHPGVSYGETDFHGRKKIKGVTKRLVEHSELVLAHYSTSLGFAVLLKKPIVFFYTDSLMSIYSDIFIPYIRRLALSLGAPCLDGKNFPYKSLPTIDMNAYNDFKYSLLTTKVSENVLSEDIVVNYIEKL